MVGVFFLTYFLLLSHIWNKTFKSLFFNPQNTIRLLLKASLLPWVTFSLEHHFLSLSC